MRTLDAIKSIIANPPTGDADYFCSFDKVKACFTEGVKTLCDAAGILFIIQAIDTQQKNPGFNSNQMWRAKPAFGEILLRGYNADWENGKSVDEVAVFEQRFRGKDFPEMEIELWVLDRMIIIPAEYQRYVAHSNYSDMSCMSQA